MRIRHVALVSTATALLAVTAACGGSTAADPGAARTVSVTIDGVGPVTTDPALAEQVPAAQRERGRITIATNAPYQPFIDFKVEGRTDQFTGLDHDLLVAASARLGLEATFTQQPFDGLVPGLQAAKYDAIAGGITDKKERQQVATFVDYSSSGTGFLVRTGNPLGVRTVADLCGRKVVVQKASNQAKNLAEFSRSDCGGRAIEVKEYPENPQAVQAMIAGNVDVVAATKVNLVDIQGTLTGRAELVDDPSAPNGWLASPNGFGFRKADRKLAEAYRSAVQALIDDGTYGRILAHWKQEPIAVPQATIDQAID